MDSLVLQTAIGLVFLFATVAGAVSLLTEMVSRFLGLRGEYLLRGLRTMLDGGGEFKLAWADIIPHTSSGQARLDKKREDEQTKSAAAAVDSALTREKDARNAAAQAQAKAAAADTTATALATAAEADPSQADAAAKAEADASAAAVVATAAAARATTAKAAATAVTAQTEGTPYVTRVMAHPLIKATADKGVMPDQSGNTKLTNADRRKLPSYVSGKSFAAAIIDMTIPDASGKTTLTAVVQQLNGLPDDVLKQTLLSLAADIGDDIDAFRTNIERWYDETMKRVSGWYKRHVRWISIALGVFLIIAFNLNVLGVARSLYTDQALRGSVVSEATQAGQCGNASPADCLQKIRSEISSVRGAGLPIGWTTASACATRKDCNWWQRRGLWGAPGQHGDVQAATLGLLVLGWLLMVLALLPGARFWYDILAKLGSLRSTGPKPAAT